MTRLNDQLFQQMAAEIHEEIPGAEVRLYYCGEAFCYSSHGRWEVRPSPMWPS